MCSLKFVYFSHSAKDHQMKMATQVKQSLIDITSLLCFGQYLQTGYFGFYWERGCCYVE